MACKWQPVKIEAWFGAGLIQATCSDMNLDARRQLGVIGSTGAPVRSGREARVVGRPAWKGCSFAAGSGGPVAPGIYPDPTARGDGHYFHRFWTKQTTNP